jgi:hypothetical protein
LTGATDVNVIGMPYDVAFAERLACFTWRNSTADAAWQSFASISDLSHGCPLLAS